MISKERLCLEGSKGSSAVRLLHRASLSWCRLGHTGLFLSDKAPREESFKLSEAENGHVPMLKVWRLPARLHLSPLGT